MPGKCLSSKASRMDVEHEERPRREVKPRAVSRQIRLVGAKSRIINYIRKEMQIKKRGPLGNLGRRLRGAERLEDLQGGMLCPSSS